MASTKEQQVAIDSAVTLFNEDKEQLLKIAAVAGAGKTYTLIELSKAISPTTGLYLAYNKSIQLEAAKKFKGTSIVCKTIHGLAYGSIVKKYNISVKPFTVRDIKEKLSIGSKQFIVDMLEKFFLSNSTDITQFLASNKLPKETTTLILKYYKQMLDGKIGGGHSLYLKLYHIFLSNGEIKPPQVELLMCDEFGDITALTIEIFKLLKARLKVAVGDAGQNIYSFTHTIDGFKALKNTGTLCKLTQSFRVSNSIAKQIEVFCKETFDPEMEFKGRDLPKNTPIDSHAYIARTNATLINKMFELDSLNIKFNVTRAPSNIFSLILTLSTLKVGKPVFDTNLKWLESVARKHNELLKIKGAPQSLLQYIKKEYSEDRGIQGAISIIFTHGTGELFRIYNVAKDNESTKHYTTLTSAHAAKGLEFSKVTLMEDMNLAVTESKEKLRTEKNPDKIDKLEEEFRLYYVAISRSMVELCNAKHLK